MNYLFNQYCYFYNESRTKDEFMPLYDFICIQCGHPFEEVTHFESSSLSCPNCSSKNTQRILSAANIKRVTISDSDCKSHFSPNSIGGCGREGCGSRDFPCGVN